MLMTFTWNSQRDLRKGKITMFGNYKKSSIEQYREPMIGWKTWTKPSRAMDTTNHVLILKSDQEYIMMNLY